MSKKENDIIEEQIDNEGLLGLIKEAAELSRISAMVSLAYSRAKAKENVKDACSKFGKTIKDKATAVVGNIKENSTLYDQLEGKRNEIGQKYEEMLNTVSQHYDEKVANLLAERARLENENLALAADSKELRAERKSAERAYRDEEQSKNGETANLITQKKKEAERLASQGDLEGAKAIIEEYRRLKEDYVMKTAEDMLEVASISQQINANKEQLEANDQEIARINEQISRIQERAQSELGYVQKMNDTEMIELNSKTSIFKRMAMFASKTVMRTFNKGKAIENEVIAPLKAKMEKKIPEIEEKLGTKFNEIKGKTGEAFRSKLDKAIELGRNTKNRAIDRLTKAIQDRNNATKQKIAEKQGYIEDGRA